MFRGSQNVIITNCVVVSSVGIKRVDCSIESILVAVWCINNCPNFYIVLCEFYRCVNTGDVCE